MRFASSADPDDFQILDDLLHDAGVGPPQPVLISAAEDARWWSGLASVAELKAYAFASFCHMSSKVQCAFLAACFRYLSPENQRAFLAVIQDERHPNA